MSWTITSGGVPAAIAGVAPLVDYRFAVDRNEIDAVSLTDKLTVTTVDADGTFVNQAGLIQQATTNIPRFDHGPVSRQSLGLLVEEQRTNLLLRSEDFSTSWTRTLTTAFGAGSLVDVETAPDETVTADLIAASSGTNSGAAFVSQDIAKAATVTTYTATVFGKAQNWNAIGLHINDTNTNNNRATVTFSLATGAVTTAAATAGTFSNASAAAVPFGNGWFRTTLIFTSSTETGLRFRVYPNNSTTITSDGTSGIYIWGAQLEVGSSPTSYIPTTTTATTRSADDIKIAAGLSGTADVDYTIVEKPAGCVAVSGSDIVLNTGFTAQRVMVFPGNVSALRTAIRAAM
jgi:hypothetical protein